MSKETIEAIAKAIVGIIALVLRKPAVALLTKFSLYLTERLPFVKKKRKKIRDAAKNVEIDKLIAAIGNRYAFNRVTIATFSNFETLPISRKEFEKLEVTITNEWTDNTNTIMQDFQNASCADLADGIYELNESMLGWIEIPPSEERVKDVHLENMITVQNMVNVVKSYRFRLGNHVVDGSMAVSFTNDSAVYELTTEDLQHLRSVAKKIYSIIKK